MKAVVTGMFLLLLDLLAGPQLAIADTASQNSFASEPTVSIDEGKIDLSSATVIANFAVSSGDSGTLNVGQGRWLGCSPGRVNVIAGFVGPRSIGSYSPIGLTGGTNVAALYDTGGNCVGNFANISISGFSSNPGSGWLSSVTCNGIANDGSAATFTYLGGTASWRWNRYFGLQSKQGSNVSCTIVHN